MQISPASWSSPIALCDPTTQLHCPFCLPLSRPGDELYSRLSVNTQLLAKVDQLLKVGRNNFRPPPKVESRVVRIEPRNPPPPVNFVEWNGLVRLCFNRKNKTLRAVLTTRSVLALLEVNYKTYCSLNGLAVPDPLPDMKTTVSDALVEAGLEGQRASKLDVDDFLRLLETFNRAGIHFS